jgi:integrase
MQGNATASKTSTTIGAQRRHGGGTYTKAIDARKRPIRGLWKRNGSFYAQLTIEDPNTGRKHVKRVRLDDVKTVAQATDAMVNLKKKRRDQKLPALKQAPKFDDYADEYFQHYADAPNLKRASTLKTEKINVKKWRTHIGHVRLNKITKPQVMAFIHKRQKDGVTGRTINLEVIAFRNVMKRAIDDGWLVSLPTENIRPLKWTPKKRSLVTLAEIQSVCDAAVKVSKNGVQFTDYVLLMAYCGSRKSETLRLKWSDVDWDRKQLIVGSDGMTKNGKSRTVDFNEKLKRHLAEMQTREAPDSDWMFPSPQRGKNDISAKCFVVTMRMAKEAAGITDFGFHDCRHFFISFCVMSGIDYMTIAKWVGHQDGGILIGKVYGHLSNEHAQQQAQRINFEPTTVKSA